MPSDILTGDDSIWIFFLANTNPMRTMVLVRSVTAATVIAEERFGCYVSCVFHGHNDCAVPENVATSVNGQNIHLHNLLLIRVWSFFV
jgi:hypothetical protein